MAEKVSEKPEIPGGAQTNDYFYIFRGSTSYKVPYQNLNLPGESNTGQNVGTGSEVFKQKLGTALQFRKLQQGSGITITQNADDITIEASGSVGAPIQFTDTFYIDSTLGDAGGTNNTWDTLANFIGSATYTGLSPAAGQYYKVVVNSSSDASNVTIDKGNIYFYCNGCEFTGTITFDTLTAVTIFPFMIEGTFSGTLNFNNATQAALKDCIFLGTLNNSTTQSAILLNPLISGATFNNSGAFSLSIINPICFGMTMNLVAGDITMINGFVQSLVLTGGASRLLNIIDAFVLQMSIANGQSVNAQFVGGVVQQCSFDHQGDINYDCCGFNGNTYGVNYSGTLRKYHAAEIVTDIDNSGGGLTVLVFPSDELVIDGHQGYGSTDTNVVYLGATTTVSKGSFTRTDNSTNGSIIQIDKDGTYTIGYVLTGAVNTAIEAAITIDASTLTAAPSTLAAAERRGYSDAGAVAGAAFTLRGEWTGELSAGQQIRLQTNAFTPGTAGLCQFYIKRLQ